MVGKLREAAEALSNSHQPQILLALLERLRKCGSTESLPGVSSDVLLNFELLLRQYTSAKKNLHHVKKRHEDLPNAYWTNRYFTAENAVRSLCLQVSEFRQKLVTMGVELAEIKAIQRKVSAVNDVNRYFEKWQDSYRLTHSILPTKPSDGVTLEDERLPIPTGGWPDSRT